jgi:hypothetical protein
MAFPPMQMVSYCDRRAWITNDHEAAVKPGNVDVPSLSVTEDSRGEPVHMVYEPRSLNRALVNVI